MHIANVGNYLCVRGVETLLGILRVCLLDSSSLFFLSSIEVLQPIIEQYGRRKAFEVYRTANSKCPAYKNFLNESNAPAIKDYRDFHRLPHTDKGSYIKKYSIEERCLHGAIPTRGVVIDESSGSSGVPNNWIRGEQERKSVKRLIQHAYRIRYGKEPLMVLNCFALGPWATGMNVSMALVDIAVLKSIGPDSSKLNATFRTFGSKYRYALAGYPPFFKDWFSSTELDLTQFEIHLIVGGEGISEGLRDFFLKRCKTVYSSYGASDLEINIGAETDFSIALRKLCVTRPELTKRLFGRDDAPMIFQYNPANYLIERSEDGELVVTVLRLNNASPRVRYNIHDIGGALTFGSVAGVLSEFGIKIHSLAKQAPAFPLLFVYGRNDLSVPFYGAKIFSTDLDQIINGNEELRNMFYGFQLSVREETSLEKTLIVDIETVAESSGQFSDEDIAKVFFSKLQAVNQDFREVSKLFGPERLLIRQHPRGSGPFQGQDIRLKNRYVLS